jgi:hypothetical protein
LDWATFAVRAMIQSLRALVKGCLKFYLESFDRPLEGPVLLNDRCDNIVESQDTLFSAGSACILTWIANSNGVGKGGRATGQRKCTDRCGC